MIASHARPEGVDTLYPSLGSAAFEARSDRRADARHRLSCVCVQGRTPSGRIAAPDSLDQSAGRLWEEPRTMQLAELVGGGMLTPRIEVGGRYDGGDAETGAGLVVGGSLGYAVGAWGTLKALLLAGAAASPNGAPAAPCSSPRGRTAVVRHCAWPGPGAGPPPPRAQACGRCPTRRAWPLAGTSAHVIASRALEAMESVP